MKVAPSVALDAVRFSFSRFSREEDVDQVLQVMPGIVKKLQTRFQLQCSRGMPEDSNSVAAPD